MPLTGTELFVADFAMPGGHEADVGGKQRDAGLSPRFIAGKPGKESVCQPRWGMDGTLLFVTDRNGFWQLYALEKGKSSEEARSIVPSGYEDAEFADTEGRMAKYEFSRSQYHIGF